LFSIYIKGIAKTGHLCFSTDSNANRFSPSKTRSPSVASTALCTQSLPELAGLSQVSLDIKRRINLCAALLRPPTELHRQIAFSLVDVWRPHCPCGCRGAKPTLGWIALGNVCHVLRTMSISHQSLWASGSFTIHGAEEDFLRLAGNQPTFIQISGRFHSVHNVSRGHSILLLEYLFRAAGVHIPCTSDIKSAIEEWSFSPITFTEGMLPLLQGLAFSLDGSDWKRTEDIIDGLSPMRTPNLTHIIFRNFFTTFDGPTLMPLSLHDTDGNNWRSPALASRFMDTIRSYANLQILSLEISFLKNLIALWPERH
jgi:hypothetical protein